VRNPVSITPDLIPIWAANGSSFCVGRIVAVTQAGSAVVDFPDNKVGPILARSILQVSPEQEPIDSNSPVLLVFERGDPALPIIVGFVRDELMALRTKRPQAAPVGAQKVTLDAKSEILLRCGKSSILLRKDGKIVVKGAHIVSRSSGPHKIKGASVNIN